MIPAIVAGGAPAAQGAGQGLEDTLAGTAAEGASLHTGAAPSSVGALLLAEGTVQGSPGRAPAPACLRTGLLES